MQMETICMKCQILFSRKNTINSSVKMPIVVKVNMIGFYIQNIVPVYEKSSV